MIPNIQYGKMFQTTKQMISDLKILAIALFFWEANSEILPVIGVWKGGYFKGQDNVTLSWNWTQGVIASMTTAGVGHLLLPQESFWRLLCCNPISLTLNRPHCMVPNTCTSLTSTTTPPAFLAWEELAKVMMATPRSTCCTDPSIGVIPTFGAKDPCEALGSCFFFLHPSSGNFSTCSISYLPRFLVHRFPHAGHASHLVTRPISSKASWMSLSSRFLGTWEVWTRTSWLTLDSSWQK